MRTGCVLLALGLALTIIPRAPAKASEASRGPASVEPPRGRLLRNTRELPGLHESRGLRVVSGLRAPEGNLRMVRGWLSEAPSPGLRAAGPEALARGFLRQHHQALGLSDRDQDLVLGPVRPNLLGTTLRFQRHHLGVPVVPGDVVVHLDDAGRVRWVDNESRDLPLPREAPSWLSLDAAVAAAEAHLRPRGTLRVPVRARQVLSTRSGKALPRVEVLIAASEPLGDWLYEISPGGEVLSRRNLLQFAHGHVFRPNPVVAEGNPGLQDQDDSAAAVPASAYSRVELPGLDGSGFLTGTFADTSPGSDRAHEPDGAFVYDRSDPRFEEVMVYYHLDFAQRYFQSLGFDNVNNRVQAVDAHGIPQDNSFYSPATKQLTFGTGGVDDAEDAEIIWHEYGHSTQDDQVPGWGSGGHARAMGEAFGDYLGAAVSERMNGFQTACIGDWDGVAYSQDDPPCLRRVDGTKHFPEDLEGQYHADGEIWSAALWEIHTAAAEKDDIVRLVLAHHFLLPAGATMPEAAEALLQADQQLYGGRYAASIKSSMVGRGILEATGTLEIALEDASGAPLGARVELLGGGEPLELEVPATSGTLSRQIPPGSYTMRLRSFGYQSPETISFELPQDGVAAFQLALEASPVVPLSGRVLAPDGSGVAASVRLLDVPLAPVQAHGDGTFSLEVPAGTYHLVVAAFGFASAAVEGVEVPGATLEVVLEELPGVLLVDDDGFKTFEEKYQESLESLGIEYLLRPVAEIREVEDLYPHEIVIWNVGNRSSQVFPPEQQVLLRQYLSAGGRLVVSGQDVGYSLKQSPFLAEVLGAVFLADTAESKQVQGQGLDFPIDQSWPDALQATDSSQVWLRYQGGQGAALVHDVLGGRVVYLGFGVEGVAELATRDALLQACFEASDLAGIRRRGLGVEWFGR